MRVYVSAPTVRSPSLARIEQALASYRPVGVETGWSMSLADLVVVYVIGRQDRVSATTALLRARGQRYAVIQLVLRSTKRPSTSGWRAIWDGAVATWSYLDLNAAIAEDGGVGTAGAFYHAPLGVDANVFTMPTTTDRPYVVLTTGQSALTEGVREAALAGVGRRVFPLGPPLRIIGAASATGSTDAELANLYGQCEFVCGLRRTEGFELPAAEGLLCGARPVLFDRPHYRTWYDGLAEFIPEGPRPGVVDDLEALFQRGARPVTDEERRMAAERFDWARICGEFWARCLA